MKLFSEVSNQSLRNDLAICLVQNITKTFYKRISPTLQNLTSSPNFSLLVYSEIFFF